MFHFLLGTLLVVDFVALLIGSPAFRKAALVIVGLIALGIYAIYQGEERAAERRRQEQLQQASLESARWKPLTGDALLLRDSKLSSNLSGDRTVTLDIKNQGLVTITGVQATVRLYDCPRASAAIDASCDTIGEASGSFLGDIPSFQARQLFGRLSFRNEPQPKGTLRWTIAISAVRM